FLFLFLSYAAVTSRGEAAQIPGLHLPTPTHADHAPSHAHALVPLHQGHDGLPRVDSLVAKGKVNSPYEYQYAVRRDQATPLSGHDTPLFGHAEAHNGHTRKGKYFVHLPDGRVQTVTYYADETGYHPTVSYEGTAHYDAHAAVPHHAPAKAYHAPEPAYHAPEPAYHAPGHKAPTYNTLKPAYHNPGPKHRAFTPTHGPVQAYNEPKRTYTAPELAYDAPQLNRKIPQAVHHAPEPAYKIPEPAYHALKPTYETPGRVYHAPKPTYTSPEPTYTTPKPAYHVPGLINHASRKINHAPKPSYTTPKPAYHAPEPAYHAPEPAYHAPEPAYHAPETAYHAPEPIYYAPRPVNHAPESTYHAPEPSYTTPEPAYHAPEPSQIIHASAPHPLALPSNLQVTSQPRHPTSLGLPALPTAVLPTRPPPKHRNSPPTPFPKQTLAVPLSGLRGRHSASPVIHDLLSTTSGIDFGADDDFDADDLRGPGPRPLAMRSNGHFDATTTAFDLSETLFRNAVDTWPDLRP
ncbi:uncharacterized protein LOC134788642, partial [Penaeus indicus]|uniref:uncharacterized protein LOC134788642 n=1 Tax=Penaeus indicus TaxID=29960 RepID=UPI00300C1267